MILDRSRPRGYYSGIWVWLQTYVGSEGLDYYTIDEPTDAGNDRWRVKEIIFNDPKHETLAQLRWN